MRPDLLRDRFTLSSAVVVAISPLLACCSRVPSPLTPSLHGSVGLPYQGVLTEPVPLPASGKGFVQIKEPGHHYATRELVDAVIFAAARVDDEIPGPPLHVGDLSGKNGGEIPNHTSHRSGRDVDLVFFTTDLGGARIASQGWTSFGSDGIGLAHAGPNGHIWVRFDLERNWLLVKSLMQAPSAGIMWLFVSNPLKALLTEYAFARGEDPVLVWQAESAMHQPRNALPHDDHFHVRIVCPSELGVAGCEEGGPRWPWIAPAPTLDWPKSTQDIAAFVDVESMPALPATP
jgi:penicillin-insensitive murein endopeptidase